MDRRKALLSLFVAPAVLPTHRLIAAGDDPQIGQGATTNDTKMNGESSMQVHYLEIVTDDAEAVCKLYADLYGIEFSDPVTELGGARTSDLAGAGSVGIRKPMHAGEKPVVRPYVLVDDIDAAVKLAKAAGAQIAVPSMEIPGRGKIAIFVLGGIESGLWQV